MNTGAAYQTTPNSQSVRGSCEALKPGSDLVHYLRQYAREKPGIAIWCFGIGFVLGWKLKPW